MSAMLRFWIEPKSVYKSNIVTSNYGFILHERNINNSIDSYTWIGDNRSLSFVLKMNSWIFTGGEKTKTNTWQVSHQQ